MSDAANQLSSFAKELGFDLVRFTPAELGFRYVSQYRDWIASGAHGEMDYLKRRLDGGIDAEKLLPSVKSVIVLAVGYRHDASPLPPGHGRIGCYATYRDYHRIIGKRLRQIEAYIRDELAGDARGFVDSGPIQERAYAESAGLGYLGKSGMLINPEFGSWLFLACVLTTLELQALTKTDDLSCGDCSKCVEACPTGAILGDGTVDARRCISYLTIEHRGAIPKAIRPLMRSRVFGCDTCQRACPHNNGARSVQDKEFIAGRKLPDSLPLDELLGCESDDAFINRFAGTPVMRTKRLGMLRNACVAAGNSGDIRALPSLQQLVERETDENLREHALWAIHRLEESAD